MASTLQDIAIEQLRVQLRGELITPADAGYDDARSVFLKGIDRRPLAVARVADAADVARVVSVAREGGLELAVRGGGHSFAGHGSSEGGIVIDLAAMKGLELDREGRSAWVETGLTAGEYTDAVGEHGLATGFGDTGSVGIGGITLAGGIGFLVRRHGLTIDDLLAAEVVTADGEIVRVSEESEPDLFWALRGAGANFGVVTRLQLRLHEVGAIVGGNLILPATPAVIGGFIEAAAAAPDELSAIAGVTLAPPLPLIPAEAHGKPILFAQIAHCGPLADADAVLAPFRALATPYADLLRPMRYPELYAGPEQEHRFVATRNFFADSLAPDAPEAIIEQLPRSSAPLKAVQLRVLGGAMARVPNDATAFAHRDRRLYVSVAALYADAAERDAHDAWVADLTGSLNPDGAGGYAGFLAEADEQQVRAAYPGPTWERLRELKRRYDPENVFRVNQNIPPA